MEYFDLTTKVKSGIMEVYPSFKINAGDIVAKGGDFYAVYDETTKMWSREEYTVLNQVDSAIRQYIQDNPRVNGAFLNNSESGSWNSYRKYIQSKPNNDVQFDSKLLFSNHKLERSDYATRVLSYSPKKGTTRSFNKILNTLYDKTEVEKIKWFIGALLCGDSVKIQKFAVFFGPPGSGKSTVINIIESLVEDYAATFVAKDLVSSNNQFGTAAFKNNPILAIQHDGDLSRIEDNTILNQLVSHETLILNEKYKGQYPFKFNGLIILGTNKAVKITDSKSGMLRRILDIIPSGMKIPYEEYMVLIEKVKFEKPAIAYECMQAYREMGISYYENHKPFKMMELTDFFYDFILESLPVIKNGVTLKHATELYIKYCDDNKLDVKAARQKVRLQLEDYFLNYSQKYTVNGMDVRDWYYDFDTRKITAQKYEPTSARQMAMNSPISYLDNYAVNYQSQYANDKGTPISAWSNVKTTLKDIDTKKLHFLRPPKNHIVIDFDLKDDTGAKSMIKNIQAASKFPATYGEFSKSGNGVHLHYIYEGDVDELSSIYSEDIEVKVFKGRSSLRRQFTYSNGINTISTISSGLPFKEKESDKMYNKETLWTEKGLRTAIAKAIRKEHHGYTAPEIDFIDKILRDATKSGVRYDVRDLRPSIMSFAMGSSNQSEKCLAKITTMMFTNGVEELIDDAEMAIIDSERVPDEKLIFFDIEVFPNVFIVVWKRFGKDKITWINPTPQEIETLLSFPLVGFNNRKYDNHILYGIMLGKCPEEIYELSKRIIANSANAGFANAYNLSYADIYEYSAKKQSLKKFEIEMGVKHDEFEFPWDEPLPEEHWQRASEYCGNDVDATEKLFHHRYADYQARLIIAELSKLPVNSKTQNHAAKILFGNDVNPQKNFIYPDLTKEFIGYTFEYGVSMYKGIKASEGGYVYSKPGVYRDVALLDVASMHPSTIVVTNYFGPYTEHFDNLKAIRLLIKHGDFDTARSLMNGAFAPYLTDAKSAKDLSYALKIVINIVYGMTSASYDNPFKHPDNIDNVVAKRGALFMIDLQEAVTAEGYEVVHIKTDSIKIANADKYIIDFVFEFGNKYGYDFEHEHTYSRFALIDKAQYFGVDENGEWETKGKLPSHPYVVKSLCTHDAFDIPNDFAEVKESKKGAIYIGDRFVGKNVRAIPITTSRGEELKVIDGQKESYVNGTKGYKWILHNEFEMLQYGIDEIDISYFDAIVKDLIMKVGTVGDLWDIFDIETIDKKFRIEEFPFLTKEIEYYE